MSPTPSAALETLRPELAGSLEEFDLAMDRQGFIGQRLFPVFEVAKSAGHFGVIPVEQLLKNVETSRAPGAPYSRSTSKFEVAEYSCVENGVEEPVDDREATMYRDYIDAEVSATQRAYDIVLRNQEKRIAAKVFNATTFAAATSGVDIEWDKFKTAQPVDHVEAAVRAIWNACGLWPNTLVINRMVFRNLRQCAQIIDRIAGLGAGAATKASDITPAMLAQVFDLDEVLVAGSGKNAAKEGQALSMSSIWSDEYAFVCRRVVSQDIREPGIGRTMHWGEDGSSVGGTVESYRDPAIRGNVIRVRHDTDEKVILAATGYLLSNITTA